MFNSEDPCSIMRTLTFTCASAEKIRPAVPLVDPPADRLHLRASLGPALVGGRAGGLLLGAGKLQWLAGLLPGADGQQRQAHLGAGCLLVELLMQSHT